METQRDEKITQICHDQNLIFESFPDYLMVEPHEVEQRKIFTPFYKLWQKQVQKHKNYSHITTKFYSNRYSTPSGKRIF